MGMEFGSTKRKRCRRSGLPVDSPHALFFGLLKSIRVCVNWTKIVHMLCCELQRHGLVCVEIDRLRQDFNVLRQ